MAIRIKSDGRLTASPTIVSLQSGQVIELTQEVSSDLGGEAATVTYTLDGRIAVFFRTPAGPSKTLMVQTHVGGGFEQRTDKAVLMEEGDTELAEVEIQQTVQGEDGPPARDRVVIGVIDET